MSCIVSEGKISENSIQEPVFCIGPLNLNRLTKKASTSFGTSLQLDENEFDVLYMLATREGEPQTFERLYAAVWDAADGSNEREAALRILNSLTRKVKEASADFMWIEYAPNSGYTFRMRWRR